MATKFATRLYAKIVNKGLEDQYLDTSENLDGLAEMGEVVEVAEYRLVGKKKVTVSINAKVVTRKKEN